MINDIYMKQALKQAKIAEKKGEIPVGCVIVKNGKIIFRAYNKKENKKCGIFHAEILAIRGACKKMKSWRLDDCIMYVTLEPCMMCMGAIIDSRISRVYYGTKNNCEQMYDKIEAEKYVYMENLHVSECSKILTDFFKKKRKK